MKKIYFALVLLVFGAQSQAQIVSESQARDAATNFFRNMTERDNASLSVKHASSLRGGNAPAYYVFEDVNGKGYVLVSGTTSAIPILGYSGKGTFDVNNIPPQLQGLLNEYEAQLEAIAERQIQPTPAITEAWESLMRGESVADRNAGFVAPLLTTTWDQDAPYNDICPLSSNNQRAATGCGATTMAQIMKYWNYPPVGLADETYVDDNAQNQVSGLFGANIEGNPYNFREMPDVVTTNSPANQKYQVALLMVHCGVALHSDYGTFASGGTSSSTYSIPGALTNHFGYAESNGYSRSDYSTEDWTQMIRDALDAGRPIAYRSAQNDTTDDGAHIWVCDGYNQATAKYHMNWGWGGWLDNWYTLDPLNPGNNTFNFGHAMIPDISVPNCQPSAWVTGVQNNAYYEAANWIHSNATVPSGSVTNFNAFEEVTMLPGFTATAGSTFRAYLEGCNGVGGPFRPAETKQQSVQRSQVATPAIELSASPNPFTTSTTITYRLDEPQNVELRIFNATGLLVATPVQPQRQEAGDYTVTFEGEGLPAGVYTLVMQAGNQRTQKRLVLVH